MAYIHEMSWLVLLRNRIQTSKIKKLKKKFKLLYVYQTKFPACIVL